MLYIYTTHSVTDAQKLKTELIAVGDLIPIFSINTDVYIESTLSETIINQIIIDAGN